MAELNIIGATPLDGDDDNFYHRFSKMECGAHAAPRDQSYPNHTQ